jgi:hypothetical protein
VNLLLQTHNENQRNSGNLFKRFMNCKGPNYRLKLVARQANFLDASSFDWALVGSSMIRKTRKDI